MTKKKDEGPRSAAVLLQHIDDGELHAELSETIQRVSSELVEIAEHASGKASGSITLTLKLAAKSNGTVAVSADVKSKTPKVVRPGSTFWLTDGGNLSPENPRQAKLPLKPVEGPTAVRELADETANIRGL